MNTDANTALNCERILRGSLEALIPSGLVTSTYKLSTMKHGSPFARLHPEFSFSEKLRVGYGLWKDYGSQLALSLTVESGTLSGVVSGLFFAESGKSQALVIGAVVALREFYYHGMHHLYKTDPAVTQAMQHASLVNLPKL